MERKKWEQQGFIVGIIINLIIGMLGFWTYQLTKLEALSLDFYFTLISVVSTLLAIIISKKSSTTSVTFPNGHFMLEPLYALVRSIFIILLLFIALIDVSKKAFNYFVYNIGVKLDVAPIIPYTIIVVLLSFSLYLYYSYQNRRINHASTMLTAEAKGVLVDCFLSGSIGLAALCISFIKDGSPFDFFLYTGDFFITVILFFFSMKEPILISKNAFIELSGGILTNSDIQHQIEQTIQDALSKEISLSQCTVYKIGMSFRIFVELEPASNKNIELVKLLEKKQQISYQLKKTFPFAQINFILT